MISLFYCGLSLLLFVLVYHFWNRKITKRQLVEADFEDLYNNAPCGYHSLDKDGNFIAINNTELSWLGYSRNEVIGKLKITDLLTPDSATTFQENFPHFLEQGWVKDLELQLMRKNGTILPVLVNSTLITDAAGNFVAIRTTVFDSDRKLAEGALRESEERFRSAFDYAAIGMALVSPEGRFLKVNHSLCKIVGYCAEELLATTFQEIAHPDDLEADLGYAGQLLAGDIPSYQMEKRYIHSSGHVIWILLSVSLVRDALSQPLYFIAQIQDITARKLAAEALRKQACIFENIYDGVILMDLEGRIIDWNPAAERMFGYAKGEVLGKTSGILHKPEESAVLTPKIVAGMLKDGRWTGEINFIRKDGTEGVCETVVVPLLNEQGQAIATIGVNREISDAYGELRLRNQAEEERAKLIAILEATPDFISSASVDGQVFYFNRSARKILGVSQDEEWANFDIPNGHPDWAYKIIHNEGIPAAIRDGIWVGETALLSHDGREIPISQLIVAHKSPDGSVKMLSTIARDITQQKKIEATLREAERRWRSLLENVRLVVVGFDNTGKVDYVNPFFLELVGYTKAEVIGQNWFETFFPLHQRQRVQNNYLELLEQEFYTHNQSVILTKSGEERVIAWNETLLKDLQGNVIGTLSIGEDITERQVIERMKDEFISVVSHELRTPLTSIHGALNLLSSGLVNTESQKGRRIIEIAAESAERLVRLVNDILELERLESGKISLSKRTCNAAQLMLEASELMQVMANRAGITLSVSPQAIQLDADPDRIIQVLTNLLGNAIKFSPRGSTVWLSVELGTGDRGQGTGAFPIINPTPSPEAPPVTKGGAPIPNTTILFKVKDQGRGIPHDKIESIFERFHQVDASDSRKKGGTGLGLAICRSIVQQHGGQIWVESTLGEGSSFYFTLPEPTLEDDNHDNQANLGD